MTQALNYSSKAVDQLAGAGNRLWPVTTAAIAYVRDKLIAAEKFILPDGGRLLPPDREKPEVPGLVFRPPFPVVALEYEMRTGHPGDGSIYTLSDAPRRIALAWDWQDDFPPLMQSAYCANLGPGVMVMEISYRSEMQAWFPGLACLHLAYDDAWQELVEVSPFVQAMVDRGQASARQIAPGQRAYPHRVVPMMLEAVLSKIKTAGSIDRAIDMIRSDTNDELIAYLDLCYALACKNVSTVRHGVSAKLNRSRARAGKAPLFDHHTLVLSDHDGGGVTPFATDRASARAHLRRGHIRRLHGGRVTWVNQTMVTGRGGFASKDYRVEAAHG